MTKLLIVFFSILAGTMGGLAINGYSVKKLRYFEDLVTLVQRLISDIKFYQPLTKDVLSAFETQSVLLKKNIDEYLAFLRGGQLCLSRGNLKKRDAERVRYFFLRLGTLDLDTQISELTAQLQEFTLLRDNEREKHKKFSGVYVKLGFLCGLALGIIML